MFKTQQCSRLVKAQFFLIILILFLSNDMYHKINKNCQTSIVS